MDHIDRSFRRESRASRATGGRRQPRPRLTGAHRLQPGARPGFGRFRGPLPSPTHPAPAGVVEAGVERAIDVLDMLQGALGHLAVQAGRPSPDQLAKRAVAAQVAMDMLFEILVGMVRP